MSDCYCDLSCPKCTGAGFYLWEETGAGFYLWEEICKVCCFIGIMSIPLSEIL